MIDESRLENVKQQPDGTTTARCPACAADGHDKSGDHLSIDRDGKYTCVMHQGPAGADHRKRIFQMVGMSENEHPNTKPNRQTWSTAREAFLSCTPTGTTPECLYLYPRAGRDFAAVGRYAVPGSDGKTFRQFHFTGTAWSNGGPSTPWPLYRQDEIDPIGPVYVCEGEKATDKAREIGLNAICSAGGSKAAHKTDRTPLAGREVIIMPDNDKPGTEYAATVAALLHGLNPPAEVRIIQLPDLPEKGDIVEFVAMHAGDHKACKEAIESIVSTTPAIPFDRRKTTSPENGKQGGRKPAPAPADTAGQFLADTGIIIRHWRGRWFRYMDQIHGYSELPESAVEELLVTWMQKNPDLRPFASRSYAGSVTLNMASYSLCGIPYDVNRPAWLVMESGQRTGRPAPNEMAFNGTVINVWEHARFLAGQRKDEPTRRPAGPDFFALDYLPFDFDAGADCPTFHNYLEYALPDPDQRAQVQRMFGLCMADTTAFEVFFFLYGASGREGKTTALNVLTAMIGRHNVAAVDITAIAERFQSWPLADCKVNLCGDFRTESHYGELAGIEGRLKDCISGGLIEYERKGSDKFTAPCRARFICAGNQLPTLIDKSDAIWERLRIIHFTVQVPDDKRDPTLAPRIIENELAGVLQWALYGLAEVIQDNPGRGNPGRSETQNRTPPVMRP